MALETYLIQIQWENDNLFQMTTKLGEADPITIIKVEENACMGQIADNIEAICLSVVKHKVVDILAEMKT